MTDEREIEGWCLALGDIHHRHLDKCLVLWVHSHVCLFLRGKRGRKREGRGKRSSRTKHQSRCSRVLLSNRQSLGELQLDTSRPRMTGRPRRSETASETNNWSKLLVRLSPVPESLPWATSGHQPQPWTQPWTQPALTAGHQVLVSAHFSVPGLLRCLGCSLHRCRDSPE